MKKINALLLTLFMTLHAYGALPASQKTEPTFSLNFNETSLKNILNWLADFSDQNILIDDSVEGKLSIRLKDTTLNKTLQLIQKTKGLTVEKTEGLYYIKNKPSLKNNPNATATHHPAETQNPPEPTLIQLKYAKAKNLAKLIQDTKKNLLSKDGQMTFDERTNTLIITDQKPQKRILLNLIKKLDAPLKQVLIEIRIVNIEKDYEKELGIRFGVSNKNNLSGSLEGANSIAASKNLADIDISKRLAVNLPAASTQAAHLGIALFKIAQGTFLDMELSALEQKGHAKIISNPRLITENLKTASIESGEEIPYQEKAGQGATSTAFKKAVLRLEVTPFITQHNKIILNLKVNQDKISAKEIQGVPAIDTRKLQTEIAVLDSQTIVLGGIHEDTNKDNQDQVPFFANIPLLGKLFQHKKQTANQKETLIFVTPKII